jgi:aldehyde:ferredoxin oxidoreductase
MGLFKSNLKWGDTKIIPDLLEKIAHRKGIGDDLAEGTMRMAAKYGGGDYAIHSKGLELAAYEPRRSVGMGLGYATANRGGCHLNAGYMVYFENLGPVNVHPLSTMAKAELTVFQQNVFDAISACGSCIFTSYAVIPGVAGKIKPFGRLAKTLDVVLRGSGPLLGAVVNLPAKALPIHAPMIPHSKAIAVLTGMKMSLGEFVAAGARVFTIERLFNVREGLVENNLPDRLTKTPQDPANPDTKVPLDVLLPKFYSARLWDSRGIPTAKSLRRLGLESLVDAIPSGDVKAMQSRFDSARLAYEKDQAVAIKARKDFNRQFVGA